MSRQEGTPDSTAATASGRLDALVSGLPATELELVLAASSLVPVLSANADVVLTDMALRTQVIGRIETGRYLERMLGRVPYGQASVLRHVVGGAGRRRRFRMDRGTAAGYLAGITVLELDADGLITVIASV